MSYPLLQTGAMKRSRIHAPRRNLLTVPPSVRPDGIERGLRILKALRLSLAGTDGPPSRPQQVEFPFTVSRRA